MRRDLGCRPDEGRTGRDCCTRHPQRGSAQLGDARPRVWLRYRPAELCLAGRARGDRAGGAVAVYAECGQGVVIQRKVRRSQESDEGVSTGAGSSRQRNHCPQAERTPRRLRCHGPSMQTPRTVGDATSTVSGASPGRRRPCQRSQLMHRRSLKGWIRGMGTRFSGGWHRSMPRRDASTKTRPYKR